MEIKKIALDDLKFVENNVRYHGQQQISALIKSLEQFGQTRAVVVDETNTILIGNGLVEAMKKSEKYQYADCYVIKGLNEKEKKKLILSDNKIFKLGIDDFDNIQLYIDDITSDGDFDIAGFDVESLKFMITDDESESAETEARSYGIISMPTIPSSNSIEHYENEHNIKEKNEHSLSVSPVETYMSSEPNAPSIEKKYIVCPNCGEVIYLD